MNYRQFVIGDLATNCYLVWSDQDAGVIDPGGPVTLLVSFIHKNGLNLQWIVNTHGHADHIMGDAALQTEFQVPLLIHEADRKMLSSPALNLSAFIGASFSSPEATNTLKSGQRLFLGKEFLTVLETPGHTPGGISLYWEGADGPGLLFAGDALFRESIGRTDLPGGNTEKLVASIREQLLVLPPETVVLPGHGETTTIGYEQRMNPFLAAGLS